jgi:hypothetical protein
MTIIEYRVFFEVSRLPWRRNWVLSFGIYLHFGACILVFGILQSGRASPEI